MLRAPPVEQDSHPLIGSGILLAQICGGKGIRTPDLLIANETLYQLSYTPDLPMKNELKHEAKNSSCPPMVSNIER